MNHQGTFEPQPPCDTFHGKALVERRSTENGTQSVLKSYGAEVAKVTPITSDGTHPAVCDVAVDMDALGAATLRHVREFLAQTDPVFRGVRLEWLRDKVHGGKTVDNGDTTRHRSLYAMHEM